MTARWLAAAMILTLALVTPSALASDKRSMCQRACGHRVFECLSATGEFGPIGKGCARAVWRKCVKSGVETCQATTTTTTTTSTTTLDACSLNVLATGQTTCFDPSGNVIPCEGTGQDGELRKGLTRAYVDNGDGTITDVRTGLMWEKLSDDFTIHDKDNGFLWKDAFALKLPILNGDGGFAGHTDWRMPSQFELLTLVSLDAVNPAIAPLFNTGCTPGCTVLTGSCTASSLTPFYWSSSSFQFDPAYAWDVDFYVGGVFADAKGSEGYVRAVREAGVGSGAR